MSMSMNGGVSQSNQKQDFSHLIVPDDGKDNYGENGFWMHEMITEQWSQHYKVRQVMFNTRSKFQQISVVETFPFGRTLVLDGQTQSSKVDEFVYHESLVHTPMLMHPNPKTVFIGGGGELATAREVLKHKSVEKVVMCDIDELVVRVCAELLPEWGQGCLDDPRLEVHYTDAYAFLEQTYKEKFDVIIMDIADPVEAGPGVALYYKEFYEMVRKERLNENGVLVTQSGCAGINSCQECFTSIYNTFRESFELAVPYISDVPSFGCQWGFTVAVNSDDPKHVEATDPKNWSKSQFTKMVEKRIDQETRYGELRFLDAESFMGMVHVSKAIRDQLEAETRVISKDSPIYVWAGAVNE